MSTHITVKISLHLLSLVIQMQSAASNTVDYFMCWFILRNKCNHFRHMEDFIVITGFVISVCLAFFTDVRRKYGKKIIFFVSVCVYSKSSVIQMRYHWSKIISFGLATWSSAPSTVYGDHFFCNAVCKCQNFHVVMCFYACDIIAFMPWMYYGKRVPP